MHEGHFCCFSCGAKGGDVLAFVMQRDGLDFKRAAQSLGAWLEAPTPADVREMEKRKRERERIRAEEETRKENERQNRILCREVLHRCEADYRKAVRDVDWDLMAELLPSVRTLANRYRELAGLEPE